MLFQDGSPASALVYAFASLASATDDVDFMNAAGDWTYAPALGADATDPAVTRVRVRPRGAMAPGSNFTIRLRYRIK